MPNSQHIHYKMYKPYGVLSQLASNDNNQVKKKFLSEFYNFPQGIMPIGRLDEKSEGLLLLTTDGKLSDTINRAGIEKEYYAQLDGIITNEALHKLEKGVLIGLNGTTYTTKTCIVKHIETPKNIPEPSTKIRLGRHRPNSWISICITEGKFRQVRKMTAAVGFPTLRLVRVRIHNITLDNLTLGAVTHINI
ncbi:23S rRNA pseudouridine2457 synthase [Cellulophaga sp. RHA_52]|uniref:pseudouridine synthase n=1 Tax=Cellulophaga sp. RHA_52 TaxID=1250036 RepID=UPI00119B00D8|nr:pseudouridine synthase [Cellulophaga sp. RHA_52]TVZ10025.1 23S rRNA pseudouridine2457 synthase [Cellulophaga sp. RHA_52]